MEAKEDGDETDINWEFAINILLKCWDDVSIDEILNSWSSIDDIS